MEHYPKFFGLAEAIFNKNVSFAGFDYGYKPIIALICTLHQHI
ncbi:hypothetical protein D1BOALGB6SA_3045 [Olavius sp. associated proteobacterium Delta 1]|nr:hypothetical protein D1BOALGB6SA_3045 [Olavius sp. associated proteobacterium Delta 1]